MCFGYSLFLEDINNDFAGGSLSYVLVILMSFTFLLLARNCPSLCPSLAVVFVRLSVFVLSMSAAVVDGISSCGPSVPVRIVSGVGCVSVCGSSVCVVICVFSFPS